MKLDEQELRTLDHLVKMATFENEHNIQQLEETHKDYVSLYGTTVYQDRLARRDHLAELACKIAGDLMGVLVEIKLKSKQQ